jgi:hypothetical protein
MGAQVLDSEMAYRKQLAANPPRYLGGGEISHI